MNVITYGRGKTLLQVQGPVTTPRQQVAADAATRAALAPGFLGQLLVQTDDNSGWVGTGLTAGDWDPTGSPVIVADATARLLAVPQVAGQLLLQKTPLALYAAASTAAGDWDILVQP